MGLTNEQLDLLLEDKELEKYSNAYHDYKMTYRDFKAKTDEIYKRLGIEIDEKSIDHQKRLERLEELLTEGYIDKAEYEKQFKRIKQDIMDESPDFENKKQFGVEIEGCVFADKGDIDIDKFLDKFIEFIEENGWYFGGGTNQIDWYGNKV